MTQTGVAGGNPVADKRADFTYTDAGQLKTIIRSMDIVAQEPSAIVTTTTSTYDPSLGWLAGLVHEINNINEDIVGCVWTHQASFEVVIPLVVVAVASEIVIPSCVDILSCAELTGLDTRQGRRSRVPRVIRS